MSDEVTGPDLVRMDEPDGGDFDVVLRGYDRRQVLDYIARVDLALSDADRMHQEDGERISRCRRKAGSPRSDLPRDPGEHEEGAPAGRYCRDHQGVSPVPAGLSEQECV